MEFYQHDLQQCIHPHPETTAGRRLESLLTPGSAAYRLDGPDLMVTWLAHVIRGVKPDGV